LAERRTFRHSLRSNHPKSGGMRKLARSRLCLRQRGILLYYPFRTHLDAPWRSIGNCGRHDGEAAKRFIRGELHGIEDLYKVIGRKERSLWADQRGHLSPGFDRLEGYVFYTTLYGKSLELISAPIKFNNNPSFRSDDLDKIFYQIAWKAVVEHSLSGVTDKNGNGIGDHLD